MPQSQKAASETGVHVLQLSTADGAEGIIIAVDGFLADGLHRAGLVEDDEVEALPLARSRLLVICLTVFKAHQTLSGKVSYSLPGYVSDQCDSCPGWRNR